MMGGGGGLEKEKKEERQKSEEKKSREKIPGEVRKAKEAFNGNCSSTLFTILSPCI